MPFDTDLPNVTSVALANRIALRNFLNSLPDQSFDVSEWWLIQPEQLNADFARGCGTVACLGGWAQILFEINTGDLNVDYDHVVDLLGLSRIQAADLFTPPGWAGDRVYTRRQAIATLDHLIATNTVQWSE